MGNPPLLVVSDLDRIEIHTKFTGLSPKTYTVTLDDLAAPELARVTVWIGEIQWMIRHGLGYNRDPILRPLDHIETRDALLDLTDPTKPREAEWPAAVTRRAAWPP